MNPPPTAAAKLARWLQWNMPAFSGRHRFAFYGGALAVFVGMNGGFDLPSDVGFAFFHEPRGIFAWLGLPHLEPTTVRALMIATYLAWASAAAGLFTPAAKILTFAGVFLALGITQSHIESRSHAQHVLLYALACLIFSTSDRDFSIDRLLHRRAGRSRHSERKPGGLGETGLPLQAFLMITVAFYFAGGLSKLLLGGPDWAGGYSLRRHIEYQTTLTSVDAFRQLRFFVIDHPILCMGLAAGSMGIELAAPLALFSRPLRHAFVVAWIGMHVGIAVLMRPVYAVHSFCVLVLVTDWRWIVRCLREQSLVRRIPEEEHRPLPPTREIRRTLAIGSFVAGIAALPSVAEIEWFPLTQVPMYSTRFTPEGLDGIPWSRIESEAGLREIADRCAEIPSVNAFRRCAWRMPAAVTNRLVLELTEGDSEPRPYTGSLRRIANPLFRALASESSGASAPPASRLGLARTVRQLVSAYPPAGSANFDGFALYYRTAAGRLPLVAGPLQPVEAREVPSH